MKDEYLPIILILSAIVGLAVLGTFRILTQEVALKKCAKEHNVFECRIEYVPVESESK